MANIQGCLVKIFICDTLFFMTRITVVDDESGIRETLSFALEKEGYEVEAFSNGEEAWKAFCLNPAHLIILDIMMPRMDGLELCRKIRSRNEEIPLMFLSSKDEEFDRILGLEIGGDDYLCKPFSLRELLTRVKVLLRRVRHITSADQHVTTGPLRIDEERHLAWWMDKELTLTISEFRILQDMAALPGAVRSRDQLITAAFPLDNYVSDRSVDSHIKRLRKKITQAAPDFDGIESVYGLGYRLRIS